MVKFLLDTNICIYLINQRPAEIIEKFKQCDVGEIGLSTITVSELMYGVSKSKNSRQNKERLEEFLAPLEIIPYDDIAAEKYGDVRAQLEKEGQLIGPLDLLIAAHALSQDWLLITNNEREFQRVKGLKVENWLD